MMNYLTRPAAVPRESKRIGGPTLLFMIDFILRHGPKVSEAGSKISKEFLEKMAQVNPENIERVYRDVEAKLALGGKFKDDVKKGEAPKTDVEKVRAQKKAFDETEKELAKSEQIPVKDQTVPDDDPNMFDDMFDRMQKQMKDYIPGEEPLTKKKRTLNAEGGVIGGGIIEGEDLGSRTGFADPNISLAQFSKKQGIVAPFTFQKVIGPSTDQPLLQKLILESLEESGIILNRDRSNRIDLQNVTDKTTDKFNSVLRQKRIEAGLRRSRFDVQNEAKDIKQFVKNKIKNKEYVSIPKIIEKFPETNDMAIRRALGKSLVKKLGKEEAAEASRKTAQTRAKAKLTDSDEVIKAINEEFKFDPDVPDSETITERIYGSDFTNADKSKQLDLITQTENDLIKYLRVLEGSREKPKGIKLPNQTQINDIVDNLLAGGEREGFRRGFRFSPGVLRNYQFSIRDTLLNLKEGTTANVRRKLGTMKGKELDEIFSLGATFRRAPGYTEAFQFIPKKINQDKRSKIDKPLSAILDSIEQGRTEMQYKGKKISVSKAINEFNKDSKKFANKNKIQTPQINLGKKFNPDLYKDFSPEAQKNIKDTFENKNYFLTTTGKKSKTILPMGKTGLDEVKIPTDNILQNIAAGKESQAGFMRPDLPLELAKGAGKLGLKALGPLGTVAGTVGLEGYLAAGRPIEETVKDPLTGLALILPEAGKNVVKNARLANMLNLGMKASTLARMTPIGLGITGAQLGYKLYEKGQEQKAMIDALTPHQRDLFESQMEGEALAGEAAGFKTGGPVDKKSKKDLPGQKDPNLPIDPSRRDFLEGSGALGLGALLAAKGFMKFGPDLKKTTQAAKVSPFTKVVAPLGKTETEFPQWFPGLINKVRKEGTQTPIYGSRQVGISEAEYNNLSKEEAKDYYDTYMGRTDDVIQKLKEEGKPRYIKFEQTDEIIGYKYQLKDRPELKVSEYRGEDVYVEFPNDYQGDVFMEYTAPIGNKDAQFSVTDARPETNFGGQPFVDDHTDFYPETVDNIDEVYGGVSGIEQYALGAKKARLTKGDEVAGRGDAIQDVMKDVEGDLD